MLTGYPPHVDFWKKRKGLAPFFPGQQEEADSWEKLEYTGHQLVPNASEPVQRLLDCLFVKNEANRPRSDDILEVFAAEGLASEPAKFAIDAVKLEKLESLIKEKEKGGMRSGGLCDCARGSHQQSTANVPVTLSQSAYDADYAAARPPSPKRPRPSAVSPINALGAKHIADLMANAAHLTCRSTEWRVGARYAFHVQSAPTPPYPDNHS
uniref:Uncharacterized protein n=1 Tax=Plectus sambesii TaxID=2011161 RepID=A0A914W4I6_9BILA